MSNAFKMFKKRLLDTRLGLVCCNCGYGFGVFQVRNLPRNMVCPSCQARVIGVVPARWFFEGIKLVKKYLEKKKLTRDEKKYVEDVIDSGSIVMSSGRDAVICMAGRGIGVRTASRILRKQKKGEELLREILDAERLYASTKRFWK